MNRTRKQALSLCLAVIMLFSVCGNVTRAAGADVTAQLNDFTLTVTQDGRIVNAGGTLDPSKPVSARVGFRVRLKTETGAVLVHREDIAEFLLATGFSLPGTNLFDLRQDAIDVGELKIVQSNGKLAAEVDFVGDPDVFAEGGYDTVACDFTAELHYAGDPTADVETRETVTILDKSFTMLIPEAPTTLSATKASTQDGQYVDWDVTVTPTKVGGTGRLDSCKFTDKLTDVGDYVLGTFKVIGSNGAVVYQNDAPYNADAKTLTYTFPENSPGVHRVQFRTKTADSVYFSQTAKTIKNVASISGRGMTEVKPEKSITYDIDWIVKEKVAEPGIESGNAKFAWIITANPEGVTLPNAVIRDILHDNEYNVDVVFDGAELYTKPAGSLDWVLSNGHMLNNCTESPASGKTNYDFALGTISTPVQLRLTAYFEVDASSDSNIQHHRHTLKNEAKLMWQGYDGVGGGDPVTASIGLNPISKEVNTPYDPATHTVGWKITVEQSDMNTNLRVMELLWYADSGFSPSTKDYTIKETVPGGLAGVTSAEFKTLGLTPSYRQRYAGGLSGDVGLNQYTVMEGDKAVGDLLVVTQDGGGTGLDVSTEDRSFSFKTEVTDPAIYLNNKTESLATKITNTAMLYSLNTKVNYADASEACPSGMLKKNMLKRDAAAKDLTAAANANGAVAADGSDAGFDYTDKTVVYRLAVNGDQVANDAEGNPILNDIVVTDVLPADWEFVEFAENAPYYIYAATKSGSTVNATGSPLTGTASPLFGAPVFGVKDGTTQRQVSFTFSTLDKPYVILLKARPTTETAEAYFSRNSKTTEYIVTNTATIGTTAAPSLGSDAESAKIKSTVLSKTNPAAHNGAVTWTVMYNPYAIAGKDRTVIDTLPEGLELRLNADGTLDTSAITITKKTMKPDGTFEAGGETVPVVEGQSGNVTYDKATRKLTFTAPDAAGTPPKGQAYQYTYITDVTDAVLPGAKLDNAVKLSDWAPGAEPVESEYTVEAGDAHASLSRSGWIQIEKQDANTAAVLGGASFSIYDATGTTLLRSAETNATTGVAKLYGLPAGDYILKETEAPSGYILPINKTYAIHVEKPGSTAITTIDGGTAGDNSIVIPNLSADNAGALTVSKRVTGTGASTTQNFTFTLYVAGTAGNNYTYTGTGGKAAGELAFDIHDTATFTLCDGQSIIIENLPAAHYTVTETPVQGYVASPASVAGDIVSKSTTEAEFTNTFAKGLAITKTVHGGDDNKEFEFNVNVTGANGSYRYIGTGGKANDVLTFTGGAATFTLKHGEGIILQGLPVGADYTVTETPDADYITTSTGAAGTTSLDLSTAAFTNTRTGTLTLRKTVTVGGNRSMDFKFIISIPEARGENIAYRRSNGTAGTLRFAADGTAEVFLRHDESITLSGLVSGWAYIVTEASETGYAVTSTGASGNISPSGSTASFTNTLVGTLTLHKTVAGGGDTNKGFVFTIAIPKAGDESFTCRRSSGVTDTLSFTGGKAALTLKHGESITINGLHSSWDYIVTEASEAGYDVTATGDRGTISPSGATASFTNTAVSELTITKIVPSGDRQKAFDFTVKVAGASGDYAYTDEAGKTGTLTFENEKADLELKHGGRIVLHKLPFNAAYTVTEKEYAAYITTKTGDEGVTGARMSTAAFTNTVRSSSDSPSPYTPAAPGGGGTLKISKTVKGGESSLTKSFAFTLSLSDPNGIYAYSGYSTPSGTLRNGGTFYLADGQHIEITGLAPGTAFAVTEANYASLGFSAERQSFTGVIGANGVTNVDFVNVQSLIPEPPATGGHARAGAISLLLSCLLLAAWQIQRRRAR
ncbi:MAG: DUF5979 domain-containing protein [Clostridia bacterium]|nr:DUF5979 domain-containing protein [Clostridia bacterium]